MQQPLTDHPEFSIHKLKHNICEYRVKNKSSIFSVTSPVYLAVFCYWSWVSNSLLSRIALALLCFIVIFSHANTVLWESIIAIPPFGFQIEVHRGLPWSSWTFASARSFIPFEHCQQIIINEGFRGWHVRYYLAVVRQAQPERTTLEVVYENTLPQFPVLLYIYRGLAECMPTRRTHEN